MDFVLKYVTHCGEQRRGMLNKLNTAAEPLRKSIWPWPRSDRRRHPLSATERLKDPRKQKIPTLRAFYCPRPRPIQRARPTADFKAEPCCANEERIEEGGRWKFTLRSPKLIKKCAVTPRGFRVSSGRLNSFRFWSTIDWKLVNFNHVNYFTASFFTLLRHEDRIFVPRAAANTLQVAQESTST